MGTEAPRLCPVPRGPTPGPTGLSSELPRRIATPLAGFPKCAEVLVPYLSSVAKEWLLGFQAEKPSLLVFHTEKLFPLLFYYVSRCPFCCPPERTFFGCLQNSGVLKKQTNGTSPNLTNPDIVFINFATVFQMLGRMCIQVSWGRGLTLCCEAFPREVRTSISSPQMGNQ